MEPQKNLLDLMPPKTAFWVGFATAILALGTLGFIVLGSCVLKGECNIASAEGSAAKTTVPAAAAAPTGSTGGTSVTVSKIAPVGDDDHILGDKNAAVTIVEYSDYQCPFCARFHPTLQQTMKAYEGKVRWVYRHFPLSFHDEAENAAEAAECAGEQGKFWEYGDALVANQPSLGEDLYKKLAGDLGLNAAQFDACRASDKFLEKIASDAKEGAAAGVTGTPGTLIFKTNAKGTDSAVVIKGAQSASAVGAAVDSLLK
jgi:protein-disulfide isomerase